MAFTRKNNGKLQLDQAHSMDDIRLVLLEAYGRLNTLQAVAKEFGTSPSTMSVWYREMGLHTAQADGRRRTSDDTSQKPRRPSSAVRRQSSGGKSK